MKLTKEIKDFVKAKEGLSLTAYLCPAGVWTIGYGNTSYETGIKVKQGDKISKERAELLFNNTFENFALQVKQLVFKSTLNDNQFSALVSFAYNVGIGALKSSTLLKKVKANPNDNTIANEFAKWNKGGGKVLAGLTSRRAKESDIYFKKIDE
jgi:lysozyme